MKFIFISTCALFLLFDCQSQNLHLYSWSGYNRTAYSLSNLNSTESFLSYGGRLAFGLEKFQIGAEYETHLTHPSFITTDQDNNPLRKDQISNTYYGALFRFNSAKVPAYRLGLILKLGAGLHETKHIIYDLPDDIILDEIIYPDKYLGVNASIGISAPIYRYFHWELHYQFDYSKRPRAGGLEEYNALHHSLQLGISLNFVFGEAARRSKKVLESKK